MNQRLNPLDVVVLAKLAQYPAGKRPPYSQLAFQLGLSPSQVFASCRRARKARLLSGPEGHERLNASNFYEFLVHGVKYAFPPDRGQPTRGMPTAYAAPPLNKMITPGDDLPPVWPYAEGNVRGYAFAPLYKGVPEAVLRDQNLYEMLALIDAIRDGKVRERQIAEKELEQKLHRLKNNVEEYRNSGVDG